MKIFGHHIHFQFLLLGLVEFVLAAGAFLTAHELMQAATDFGGISPVLRGVWTAGFAAAVTIGVLAMGLYHPKQRLRTAGVLARLTVALVIATIGLALIDFFFLVGMRGGVWGVSLVLSLVLLSLARIAFSRFVDHEAFRRRVLVIGAGERAGRLLELRRRSDQRGFRLVAFVPMPGDRCRLEDARVDEFKDSFLEYAKRHNVNEIVVAMDERRQSLPIRELLECRFAGIEVIDVLAFLERETGKVKVDLVTPAWMIFSDGFTANALRDFVSRTFDLLVVAATAPITVPLMLGVAIVIVLEDGRPVFYRQRRVGLRGREFVLFKFRSMVKDAEADGQARWATSDDERITRTGAVIRKLRLDELPQLINVLRGDMALVGPRPERPEFVESLTQKIPYYGERHAVKPGITGWAQMSYPYGSSEQDAMEKLAYDLYYVKHRSFIFDLVVLLQTAEVVIWQKGAR